MSQRVQKINSLIEKSIGDLLSKELSLKEGVFVTLTKVDTTSDLRYTRVFVSVFPEKETSYALKTLQKEIYKLQGSLNRLLHMRPLPKVEFHLDDTEVQADKIEKLLREI